MEDSALETPHNHRQWMPQLAPVVSGSLLFWLVLPKLLPARGGGAALACGTTAWCASDAIDLAVSEILVFMPLFSGLLSHVFTMVACPVLSLHALRAANLDSAGTFRQDSAIFVATFAVNMGVNRIVKDASARQRPCYYWGREGATEASLFHSQEFRSFYSGDTSLAWAAVAAATSLLVCRGCNEAARRVAVRGAALAGVGSLLRIVGDMHWLTDVLVGTLAGIAIGAGMPPLILRAINDGDYVTLEHVV
uniref:Phosphatidic acid phosphatase type 2/haloperoxidase domain-containing protein n=1 Tax=Corethron hystrix TaxID=216773 RepID=A0A6U5KB34_9STRA